MTCPGSSTRRPSRDDAGNVVASTDRRSWERQHNTATEDVHARLAGTDTWVAAKPDAEVSLGAFDYDGLCSPPDRWLPDTFAGLEVKRADGSVTTISRQAFEAEAVHDRGWVYRFRGDG